MIFWSIIISKTLIEIWFNFQTLLRLINCTTYQNFIRFYLVVRLLTWVKNPGMETFSMILPLTPNHGGDWRIHKNKSAFKQSCGFYIPQCPSVCWPLTLSILASTSVMEICTELKKKLVYTLSHLMFLLFLSQMLSLYIKEFFVILASTLKMWALTAGFCSSCRCFMDSVSLFLTIFFSSF